MLPNDRKINVAVLLGGTSSEREVSLMSGRSVIQALNPKLYRVMVYDPAVDLAKIARNAGRIDVALVMLHGGTGEDGSIQGFLELLGIPYQCAGVEGCALAMDKVRSKLIYRSAGIPVAPDVVLKRATKQPVATLLKSLQPPVVIKPSREGSSFGIAVVHKKRDLAQALRKAFKLDDEVLVEAFLEGRELTSAVLGNYELESLPLVEIRPSQEYSFFDYEAKYTPGASEEICPAPLDAKTTKLIQKLAQQAHLALGLTGYSRSDFILTDQGPIILETNTVPGMTPTSLLPQAAAAAGMDFPALLRRLMHLAVEKSPRKPGLEI